MDRLAPFLLVAATVAGCGYPYVYLPAEHATATVPETGQPAALYEVPPSRPEGQVKVAVLGTRDIEDTDARELLVRFTVENNSDAPWRLDLREQRLVLADNRARTPSLVYGGTPGQTIVEVPARGQRVLDLSFIIDKGERDLLRTTQLAWAVSTPGEYVTERTPFRRERMTPAYVYGPPLYDGWAFAPYYYRYPWYGSYGSIMIVGTPLRAGRLVAGRQVWMVPPPVARPAR